MVCRFLHKSCLFLYLNKRVCPSVWPYVRSTINYFKEKNVENQDLRPEKNCIQSLQDKSTVFARPRSFFLTLFYTPVSTFFPLCSRQFSLSAIKRQSWEGTHLKPCSAEWNRLMTYSWDLNFTSFGTSFSFFLYSFFLVNFGQKPRAIVKLYKWM